MPQCPTPSEITLTLGFILQAGSMPGFMGVDQGGVVSPHVWWGGGQEEEKRSIGAIKIHLKIPILFVFGFDKDHGFILDLKS